MCPDILESTLVCFATLYTDMTSIYKNFSYRVFYSVSMIEFFIHIEFFFMMILTAEKKNFLSKGALLEKFRNVCSEVVPSARLYLSGATIAQDRTLLKELQITHIVNVAGDSCKNAFPLEFKYITFLS